MIIPRSPSPAYAEETAVEDLTPEEMREIIRRQREQAIKVEDEVPNLKRERPLSSIVPLRPMKTSKTSEGNTVYHLESDEEDETTLPPPAQRGQEPIEIVDLYRPVHSSSPEQTQSREKAYYLNSDDDEPQSSSTPRRKPAEPAKTIDLYQAEE